MMRIIAIRLDLVTTPRATIRENDWMQSQSIIVAMLREAVSEVDHSFMAARCEEREGEVTLVLENQFVRDQDFMTARDILEAVFLFTKEDIANNSFRYPIGFKIKSKQNMYQIKFIT